VAHAKPRKVKSLLHLSLVKIGSEIVELLQMESEWQVFLLCKAMIFIPTSQRHLGSNKETCGTVLL